MSSQNNSPRPVAKLYAIWWIAAFAVITLTLCLTEVKSNKTDVHISYPWMLIAFFGFFLVAYLATEGSMRLRYLRCAVTGILISPLSIMEILVPYSNLARNSKPIDVFIAVLIPPLQALLFRILISLPQARAIRLAIWNYAVICLCSGVIWFEEQVRKNRIFPPENGADLLILYVFTGLIVLAALHAVNRGEE